MSTFGVQADTVVGLGIEHTLGHYQAPQKYLPITSESLSVTNETVEGRELTGTSDVTYVKPGNESVEGSIEMDAKHDCIPWLLYGMRGQVTRDAPNNLYYITANNEAVPREGLNSFSLTIRRAGQFFCYTGVKINRLGFDVNDGLLSMSMDVMGTNEAVPAGITSISPSFTLTPPFGAGEYAIFIPAEKQNYGTDSFNLEIDDGGEILFRLRDDKRTPTINKWGERSISSSNELDFINKDEYDKYRAAVADRDLRYFCKFKNPVGGVTPSLNLFLPRVFVNDYSVDTSGGQGDLVRASGSYMAVAQSLPSGSPGVVVEGATTATRRTRSIYDLEVVTNEDIVLTTDSTNKPTGPTLGTGGAFTWDSVVSAHRTGWVIRWRLKDSSVFDWKVKELVYTSSTTPNLTQAQAGTGFTLGGTGTGASNVGTPGGSNDEFDLPGDMVSGATYDIQVAERYGATSFPGSGRTGAWSDLLYATV